MFLKIDTLLKIYNKLKNPKKYQNNDANNNKSK